LGNDAKTKTKYSGENVQAIPSFIGDVSSPFTDKTVSAYIPGSRSGAWEYPKDGVEQSWKILGDSVKSAWAKLK
jgi:hypothetical protein